MSTHEISCVLFPDIFKIFVCVFASFDIWQWKETRKMGETKTDERQQMP